MVYDIDKIKEVKIAIKIITNLPLSRCHLPRPTSKPTRPIIINVVYAWITICNSYNKTNMIKYNGKVLSEANYSIDTYFFYKLRLIVCTLWQKCLIKANCKYDQIWN